MAHNFYNTVSGKWIGCQDDEVKLFIPVSSILHIRSRSVAEDGVEITLSSGNTEPYTCDSLEFLTAFKNFLDT